jgi:pimeloyl-ACP methyl ester carboxylesterase
MASLDHAHSPNGMGPEDDYGVPGQPSWLEVDWRQHLRSAEIGSKRVNYVDIGDGPPVVFVHGLSGCWQNWLENLPYFAQRHRVVAMDLPGFAASEMPAETITIPAYGRFLDAFMDHLGIESAALVGNSMGGFISAEVAIAHPSRVDILVLVSAAGITHLHKRVTPTQVLRAARWSQPLTRTVLARSDYLIRRRRGRRLLLGTVARFPEKLAPHMCVEMLGGANSPGFADALQTTLEYDFSDRLEEVSVPAMILWGRNDLVVPVRCAHAYEQHLNDSRKVILEHTGHVPMIERPQTFNRLVDEFIRSAQAHEPPSRRSVSA